MAKIKSVYSKDFKKYGRILTGYDTKELIEVLNAKTDRPKNAVIYEPTLADLEKLPIAKEFSTCAYGGMPIQIGFCNGSNTKLNCLEYHRGSELNIPAEDVVLILASLQDVKDNKINSSKAECFRVPAGLVVEVYETTLHYAPCNDIIDGKATDGFRVVIVLPKDTNTQKPEVTVRNDEDKLLWAKNKWLIAHPNSAEAKQGAFVGIEGENIDLLSK